MILTPKRELQTRKLRPFDIIKDPDHNRTTTHTWQSTELDEVKCNPQQLKSNPQSELRTIHSSWRQLSQSPEIVSVGRRKVSISSDAKRIPGGNSGPANKASGQKLPDISKAKLQSSTDFYDEISSELRHGHTPTPWK